MSKVARQGDGSLGTVVINHSVTPGVFAAIFTPTGKLIVSENQPGGTDISSNSSLHDQREWWHRGHQPESAYPRRWQLLERHHLGWKTRPIQRGQIIPGLAGSPTNLQ